MPNCPSCKNFVPDCCYGCYCNFIKRPLYYDEEKRQWVYVALGFTPLKGFTVIANKNVIPFQVENRVYKQTIETIEICDGWGAITNEFYVNLPEAIC